MRSIIKTHGACVTLFIGVLALSRARDPVTGRCLLRDRVTTIVPSYLERIGYILTYYLGGMGNYRFV